MPCLQSVFLEFHSHGDREKEKKEKMKNRHEFWGFYRDICHQDASVTQIDAIEAT